DAGSEHPALFERKVVVGLLHVPHLSVGGQETVRQRRHDVRIGEPAAGNPILGDFATPRMAAAAGLDLLAPHSRRDAAVRLAAARVLRPGDPLTLVEARQQSLGRILTLAERPETLLRARPRDMVRALAVTRLAADADLDSGGGETVARRVVVL